MDLYQALTEACEHVGTTQQADDREKWKHYLGLTSASQLEWRKREGHAEFCRLQRLAFHKFI